MNRRRTFLCLALAAALPLAGCGADNEVSLEITSNQVLDRMMGCTFMAMAMAMNVRPNGVFDVGVLSNSAADGYQLYPIVKNNLNMNPTGAGSINSVTLEGADVELVPDSFLARAIPPSARKFSVSGFGGGVDPGATGSMAITAIPKQIGLQFIAPVLQPGQEQNLKIRFRVAGTRAGGRITSGWVEFPVRVCNFCLTGGPPTECRNFTSAEVQLGSCNPAQDTNVTCCNEANGGRLLCGSQVPMKMGM